jgi:Fe-S-cluster containining protein
MIYKHYTISAVSIGRDLEDANVPCGDCLQCCVSLTPYLTPEEFESGQYIYTLLAGPDNTPCIAIPRTEDGCVYLKNNKCSIYETRPKACRQFDCRKGHYLPFKDLVKQKFNIDIEEHTNEV